MTAIQEVLMRLWSGNSFLLALLAFALSLDFGLDAGFDLDLELDFFFSFAISVSFGCSAGNPRRLWCPVCKPANFT
ncbi:membrane protein [Rhodopirellula maiorica SM1]|uniref:Membrane protein n=1 Tax=Rhodopirellula maiorica SM1 TaxID=1265738 RepID=M5RDE3_9BACT|nr:membrane protein [Rhodopirellula maiorica SM1]